MTILRRWNGSKWEARGFPDLDQTPPPGGRDSLVFETYYPDPTTSGVLTGVTRRDWNSRSTSGTVTLTATSVAGMPTTADGFKLLENFDFWGDINIQTSKLRFKNCFGHGGIGHPNGNQGCFTLTGLNNHSDVEFWDCTATAQSPSYYRDGWVGNNYRAYRCLATGVNDGFGAYSNPNGSGDCNVELWGCYSDGLVWWSQDPAHSDGTHNDCSQFQGGDHYWAIGNNFRCYCTTAAGSTTVNTRPVAGQPGVYYAGSAIILNQNTHIGSDILIRNNLLVGGYAELQLNRGSKYATLSATLGPNLYGRDIYDNYPANPDKRWITLGTTGYDGVTGLYTQQRFADTNALLVAGRATGIRII